MPYLSVDSCEINGETIFVGEIRRVINPFRILTANGGFILQVEELITIRNIIYHTSTATSSLFKREFFICGEVCTYIGGHNCLYEDGIPLERIAKEGHGHYFPSFIIQENTATRRREPKWEL